MFHYRNLGFDLIKQTTGNETVCIQQHIYWYFKEKIQNLVCKKNESRATATNWVGSLFILLTYYINIIFILGHILCPEIKILSWHVIIYTTQYLLGLEFIVLMNVITHQSPILFMYTRWKYLLQQVMSARGRAVFIFEVFWQRDSNKVRTRTPPNSTLPLL